MSEPVELQLSPNALTTVERARSYLQHAATQQDFELASAIEFATGLMETQTRRRLAERWYCETVSKSGLTMGADSVDLTTGAAFDTDLRVAMDAFHAGGNLRWGARVRSITSATACKLTLPAKAALAAQVVTFGSADGSLEFTHGGGRQLLLPEYPVSEVKAVTVLYTDGTTRALSLANARLRPQTGIYIMGDEYPATGEYIRVEFRAGYRAPTVSDRAHEQPWRRLEHLCLRCVQVLWQDYRHEIGRSVEVNLRDQLLRFTSLKLPEDIRDGLFEFAREEM